MTKKLIPLIINNCLNHKDLPIYGSEMNIRWLYVEYHCKAIDMVLKNGVLGEVYNMGGHNEKTNIQIVKKIIDYINKSGENIELTINDIRRYWQQALEEYIKPHSIFH
ncbi:GDP-mannose 4,6-dehydratase [Clostridium bowmanii]|nr:GDP-mannose 4,6-dehydratase [Clostridium bowmanii]